VTGLIQAQDADGLLRVAIDGRVTAQAVAGFRDALEAAVAAGVPFAVLFDRRSMTAPTAEGRDALLRWSAELLPRLHPLCVAWADVFDARRAAALQRSGGHAEHGYPQRTFASVAEAERWLFTHLLRPGTSR
jgi:hypothetical protein